MLQGQSNVTFNNSSDLDNYLLDVYNEALEYKNNSNSSAILDTFTQMPFFCNIETYLNTKFQRDLQRYSYSQDTATSPYKGDFGSTPRLWVDKYFIIKGVINTHQQREVTKRGRKLKANN